MAANRAFKTAQSTRVFGQRQELAKTFRVDCTLGYLFKTSKHSRCRRVP